MASNTPEETISREGGSRELSGNAPCYKASRTKAVQFLITSGIYIHLTASLRKDTQNSFAIFPCKSCVSAKIFCRIPNRSECTDYK